MNVRQISANDTYHIRGQMLRPGRDVSECVFKGDESDQTLHLGAFVEKKLVSIASFYFNQSQSFEAPNQFQLRGMAALPEFQNQGLSLENY